MEATTKKKKFQFPDVYALIFILCCLAMVLTWIIPAGTFERVTEGTLTKSSSAARPLPWWKRVTPCPTSSPGLPVS